MDKHSTMTIESIAHEFDYEPSPFRSKIPLKFTEIEKRQIALMFNSSMHTHSSKKNEDNEDKSNTNNVLLEKASSFDEADRGYGEEKTDIDVAPADIFHLHDKINETPEQLHDFLNEFVSDAELYPLENVETTHMNNNTDQSTKSRKSMANARENLIPHENITIVDVLLGRGKRSYVHEGNEQFRRLVTSVAAKYKSYSKNGKTELSIRIVDFIDQMGGRFLARVPNSNSWKKVESRVARRKTSQALRDACVHSKKM